MLNILATVLHW